MFVKNGKSSAELFAERSKILEEAEAFNHATADSETGALSAEDQATFNAMLCKAEEIRKGAMSRQSEEERFGGTFQGLPPGSTIIGGKLPESNSSRSAEFVNAENGQPLAVLDFDSQLSAPGRIGFVDERGPTVGHDRPSIGATIHSLLTGDGGNVASNITGSDSSGGYLANPEFSREVLDLARSASVAMRYGARTVPMTSGELHLARVTQDVSGSWRREGQGIPSSQMAFDRVTLRPKTLAAITSLTIELAEDASNIASLIELSMQNALGLALDQAILFGAGSEAEPQGITNTPGVNTEASVGTPAGYGKLTSAVQKILTANYAGDMSNLAWLAHPRDLATFDSLTDQQDQPLNPTPWAAKLRQGSTTSFSVTDGGGSDESTMIVGDLSQVLVGMRTSGVRIELIRGGILTDSGSTIVNAAQEMQIIIRAYLRADVAVLRPSFLTVLSGVTAGS